MKVAFIFLVMLPAIDFAAEPAPTAHRAGFDWPRFLGPTGDSISREKGIITPWPNGGLRVVWHTTLGLGYAPPVISRGRLFHFSAFPDTGKTNIARLTCCESETGKEIWKFEYKSDFEDSFGYDNGPRCSPIIDGDRVYILGAEGMLHCLNFGDGKLNWKLNTLVEYGVVPNFFGVGSCPVVEGDLLLVPIGGSPQGSDPEDFLHLKGNGTAIVAFDKWTGKEKYRVGDELAGYSTPIVTRVGDKRLGLYFGRGGLMAFDPLTGRQEFHFHWRYKSLVCVNAANPVVVGDKILISECYGPGTAVLKVKPGAVDTIWTDEDKGRDASLKCHWNTPIHFDGYVYGCSGRNTNDADLRCIELSTGKVMWKQPGLDRCSLLMVDGHFVCLSEYGQLRLLKVNPEKYEEVSHWDLGGDGPLKYPCWAAPVLSHGLLYVRGKDELLCLELIPADKK